MKCWKSNFKKTPLKQGIKYKDDIKDISYDGRTFRCGVKSEECEVELVIQDDLLYDMDCTCSKKGACAHEAAALYFLEEFPEILEDFEGEAEKIKKANVNDDLKVISKSQLVKFLKKEFRKNPKLKYDFIKHFSEESLIDTKEYERKLNGIMKGKRYGYYDLDAIGGNIKKFMKKDIYTLIEQGESKAAFKLLNKIMDTFIDPLYWNDRNWYEIAYYYREYCNFLFRHYSFTKKEKEHAKKHIREINNIVF